MHRACGLPPHCGAATLNLALTSLLTLPAHAGRVATALPPYHLATKRPCLASLLPLQDAVVPVASRLHPRHKGATLPMSTYQELQNCSKPPEAGSGMLGPHDAAVSLAVPVFDQTPWDGTPGVKPAAGVASQAVCPKKGTAASLNLAAHPTKSIAYGDAGIYWSTAAASSVRTGRHQSACARGASAGLLAAHQRKCVK